MNSDNDIVIDNVTLNDIKDLIKYLKIAINNIKLNPQKIVCELERWRAEISIKELNDSLNLILGTAYKWLNLYKATGNILEIGLKEYDTISKESAYILGECSLIHELYIEVIDFQIGSIGAKMCKEIKKGGITHE